jgi:hypothetical protein
VVFVGYTGTKDVVTPRLLPLCAQHGLRALFCQVDAAKRVQWIKEHAPDCDVMFINFVSGATGMNLVDFQTAIFYQVPYSPYIFQQAPARLRRPTQRHPVEIVYLNEVGTIVEDALALMFEKLSAANAFRGDTMEGALGEVTAAGSFVDELVRRTIEGSGQRQDLEALFARYCRDEVTGDELLVEPPPPVVTPAADVLVVTVTRAAPAVLRGTWQQTRLF